MNLVRCSFTGRRLSAFFSAPSAKKCRFRYCLVLLIVGCIGLHLRILIRYADVSVEPTEPGHVTLSKANGFIQPDKKKNGQHENLSYKPILVIGGSDGSGTRVLVDAVSSLGVTMLWDDKSTFDLVGANMFEGYTEESTGKRGWPILVDLILRSTHSSNYNWNSLPIQLQRQLTAGVEEFLYSTAQRGRLLASRRGSSTTNVVAFGFKVPVSLLLLPVLAHFYGKLYFLHVVRDGRDVALSKNQSPVEKFFASMYTDHETRSKRFGADLVPVKAMQLWNDWNVQTYEWSQSNAHLVKYLAVRSEDLLDPTSKAQTLRRIATFVGSDIDDRTICCLARTHPEDFGASHKHALKRFIAPRRKLLPETVKERYGKWHKALRQNSELSRHMHQQGEVGLRLFGYEPRRDLNSLESATKQSLSCQYEKTPCP